MKGCVKNGLPRGSRGAFPSSTARSWIDLDSRTGRSGATASFKTSTKGWSPGLNPDLEGACSRTMAKNARIPAVQRGNSRTVFQSRAVEGRGPKKFGPDSPRAGADRFQVGRRRSGQQRRLRLNHVSYSLAGAFGLADAEPIRRGRAAFRACGGRGCQGNERGHRQPTFTAE